MQRWQAVTQDQTLILFAFATRAHFLREMLQTFRRDSFRVGGTRRAAKFPVVKHMQQTHIHRFRQCIRSDIAESHESSVCTLSSLALRFDQFYGMRIGEARHPGPAQDRPTDPVTLVANRLRTFRPVVHVCECQAKSFAAFFALGDVLQEDVKTVTVSARIVAPRQHFPNTFRGISLLLEPCEHSKVSNGQIPPLVGTDASFV